MGVEVRLLSYVGLEGSGEVIRYPFFWQQGNMTSSSLLCLGYRRRCCVEDRDGIYRGGDCSAIVHGQAGASVDTLFDRAHFAELGIEKCCYIDGQKI